MTDAGPELDARIAEEVMGWRREPTPHRGWPKYKPPSFTDSPSSGIYKVTGTTEDSWITERWSPTIDHTAAWEVVEKVQADLDVAFSLIRFPSSNWFAVFGDSEREADTAPVAICLAALAAKEERNE